MHDLVFIYAKALMIRKIEEEIALRYWEQEMRCPIHLSIGQEMNACAITRILTDTDYMVSTHRSHAHYLAKNGNVKKFVAELYGKSTGCSRGHGGSMHLVDQSMGFMGSTSIVGGTIPIGVGLAFAAKLKGEKRKTVVCLGDGATEEGVFHEALNFAVLHNLSVIFYVENNQFSCYTDRDDRQKNTGYDVLAEYYGMDYFQLRWATFFDDYEKLLKLDLDTPIIIESEAWRFYEHCGPNKDDHLNYRNLHDLKFYEKHDLLKVLEKKLFAQKHLTTKMLDIINKAVETYIESIFQSAKEAPYPDKDDLGKYLYAKNY